MPLRYILPLNSNAAAGYPGHTVCGFFISGTSLVPGRISFPPWSVQY